VLLRRIEKEDGAVLARLHKSAYQGIRDHFTGLFPDRLLTQFYAELVSSNTYSYIAFDESQKPVGFIVGGLNTKMSVRSFVSGHRIALAILLLYHPRILLSKLMCTVNSNKSESRVPMRLFSIAVESSQHHKGTGQTLLSHFEQQLWRHGICQYGLSVKRSNIRAIQFYEKSMFEIEFETPDAKYYIKRIAF
jgi:ribosomal protein S18 acetylase RimI-like enzyme